MCIIHTHAHTYTHASSKRSVDGVYGAHRNFTPCFIIVFFLIYIHRYVYVNLIGVGSRFQYNLKTRYLLMRTTTRCCCSLADEIKRFRQILCIAYIYIYGCVGKCYFLAYLQKLIIK